MMIQRKRDLMKSDIRERDDKFILDIDLPGFQKEDIKAYIQEGYLTVSAVKKEEKERKAGKMIRQERYRGAYQRSFYIGKGYTQEDIKASYRHGVLKLEIPKEPQKKALVDQSIQIG